MDFLLEEKVNKCHDEYQTNIVKSIYNEDLIKKSFDNFKNNEELKKIRYAFILQKIVYTYFLIIQEKSIRREHMIANFDRIGLIQNDDRNSEYFSLLKTLIKNQIKIEKVDLEIIERNQVFVNGFSIRDYIGLNYESYLLNIEDKGLSIDEENFELIKKGLKEIFNIKEAKNNINETGTENLNKKMNNTKSIDFSTLKNVKKNNDYYDPISSLIINEFISANRIKTIDLPYKKVSLLKEK